MAVGWNGIRYFIRWMRKRKNNPRKDRFFEENMRKTKHFNFGIHKNWIPPTLGLIDHEVSLKDKKVE